MKKLLNNTFSAGLLIVSLVVLVKIVLGPSAAATPAALAGVASLEQAIEKANEEHKVVFAVATSSRCAPCQSYKKGALADESVQAWIDENAIGILIDIDASPSDAERLQVRSIPTTFIIKNGTIVGKEVGLVSKSALLKKLEPYTLANASK